jgi:hypothetical protein
MNRSVRIARITTGLVGAGAICGAIAGSTALTIGLLFDGGGALVYVPFFGGAFGAVLGAVAAPVLGWSLLRRVPFGRMFIACSAGTIVGGVIGWIATPAVGNEINGGLGGAVIGCVVAAINLWYRALPRRSV